MEKEVFFASFFGNLSKSPESILIKKIDNIHMVKYTWTNYAKYYVVVFYPTLEDDRVLYYLEVV